MPPTRVLQLVALADVGAFVPALIERRDQAFGKRFDFAGDELSGEEQAVHARFHHGGNSIGSGIEALSGESDHRSCFMSLL
jgi:hypothetical protein